MSIGTMHSSNAVSIKVTYECALEFFTKRINLLGNLPRVQEARIRCLGTLASGGNDKESLREIERLAAEEHPVAQSQLDRFYLEIKILLHNEETVSYLLSRLVQNFKKHNSEILFKIEDDVFYKKISTLLNAWYSIDNNLIKYIYKNLIELFFYQKNIDQKQVYSWLRKSLALGCEQSLTFVDGLYVFYKDREVSADKNDFSEFLFSFSKDCSLAFKKEQAVDFYCKAIILGYVPFEDSDNLFKIHSWIQGFDDEKIFAKLKLNLLRTMIKKWLFEANKRYREQYEIIKFFDNLPNIIKIAIQFKDAIDKLLNDEQAKFSWKDKNGQLTIFLKNDNDMEIFIDHYNLSYSKTPLKDLFEEYQKKTKGLTLPEKLSTNAMAFKKH